PAGVEQDRPSGLPLPGSSARMRHADAAVRSGLRPDQRRGFRLSRRECAHDRSGVEPILLPNDAVSGGGFATIGTVIAVDLDRVGQSKTGDTTRFTSVRIDDGYRAWDERENLLTESSIVQGR